MRGAVTVTVPEEEEEEESEVTKCQNEREALVRA